MAISLRSSLYAEDPIRYDPVSRQVIESRLQKYVGNDKQREDTLRQMFSQAGCDDQHHSQQPVKRSKLLNLICVLPGSTNRVVIVGAHFDHDPAGDGVVDNWAGAALLPSIYEALKTSQEDIRTSSSGSQMRNAAKWVARKRGDDPWSMLSVTDFERKALTS